MGYRINSVTRTRPLIADWYRISWCKHIVVVGGPWRQKDYPGTVFDVHWCMRGESMYASVDGVQGSWYKWYRWDIGLLVQEGGGGAVFA